MKATYLQQAAALTLTFGIAACVSSSPAPAPVPPPVRNAAPAPAPAALPPVPQAPVYDSWIDAPATPGVWRYGPNSTGSEAGFWSTGGMPLLRLSCRTASRSLVLSLPDNGARQPVVTVRAETATRTLAARLSDREMTAELPATDPLLDAMALSKGRFAIETEGLPPLYLPSHAEVSRVIEDCRG